MRGGARANAGRKPKLDAMQRCAVGISCESRMGTMADELVHKKLNKILSAIEYDDAVALNREGLSRDGPRYVNSDDFRYSRTFIDEELLAAARESAARVHVAGRWVNIPRARPQSVRPGIIAEVAAEWSERLGYPISSSTVKKCWDEWRSIEKRMRAEDEQASKV